MAPKTRTVIEAYRGAYHDDLYNEDEPKEVDPEEEFGAQEDEPKTMLEDTPQPEPEPVAVDWEKRYSDLMSYKDRLNNEHKQELETMRAEIASLKKKQERTFNKVPEDQLAEFQEEYGEVYDVIKTVAENSDNQRVEALEAEIAALKQENSETKHEKAYNELLVAHPDFVEIQKAPEFLEWLEVQPKQISDGILNNSTDAAWASRIVTLYKAEAGLNKPKKSKKSEVIEAAQSIANFQTADVYEPDQPKMWKASEIAKMRTAEYLQHEAEIDAAMAEGRIIQDT